MADLGWLLQGFTLFMWQKSFRNTSRMLRFEKHIVEHGPAAGNDIPGAALLWTCSPEGILLRHCFTFGTFRKTGSILFNLLFLSSGFNT